jgi:hypothetical protein
MRHRRLQPDRLSLASAPTIVFRRHLRRSPSVDDLLIISHCASDVVRNATTTDVAARQTTVSRRLVPASGSQSFGSHCKVPCEGLARRPATWQLQNADGVLWAAAPGRDIFSHVVLVRNNVDSEINLGAKRWRVRGTGSWPRVQRKPPPIFGSGVRYSRPINSRNVGLDWLSRSSATSSRRRVRSRVLRHHADPVLF